MTTSGAQSYTGATTLNVLANDFDLDGDPLSIIAVDGSAISGTLELVGGSIYYTPYPDLYGSTRSATTGKWSEAWSDIPHASGSPASGNHAPTGAASTPSSRQAA